MQPFLQIEYLLVADCWLVLFVEWLFLSVVMFLSVPMLIPIYTPVSLPVPLPLLENLNTQAYLTVSSMDDMHYL